MGKKKILIIFGSRQHDEDHSAHEPLSDEHSARKIAPPVPQALEPKQALRQATTYFNCTALNSGFPSIQFWEV